MSCKYVGIGCTKKLPHKGVQQHENDDASHLHLARETVIEQQKEIEAVRDELDGIKYTLTLKQQDDNIMAGPCVLKMTNFNQHVTSKQKWYSPPFYTQAGGYKMCIKVYASGRGDGADTHVSVFVSLMKGRNDDNLPWPFTGKVTITLLNQLEDENHHSGTMSFPPDSDVSGRVVDREIASTGYGHPKFISHAQLSYDAAKNCQYLKDDCLYLHFKVQAAKPAKRGATNLTLNIEFILLCCCYL